MMRPLLEAAGRPNWGLEKFPSVVEKRSANLVILMMEKSSRR
jgi:hypothetical protein